MRIRAIPYYYRGFLRKVKKYFRVFISLSVNKSAISERKSRYAIFIIESSH